MEVFVHREPTGYTTFDLEGIEDLEEHLRGVDTFQPLDDSEEVRVEITGKWGAIRELLSQPVFKKIWFDPKYSPSAIQYFCDVCGAGEWGHSDRLPKGWSAKKEDTGGVILCEKCNKPCSEENPCCDRHGEYNGFGSGPLKFICPKHCSCHD